MKKITIASIRISLLVVSLVVGCSAGVVPVFAQTVAATTATTTASSSGSISLKLGMSGVAVGILQKLLISEGYLAKITPTSYFGTLTEAAVKKYQQALGLPVTGIFTIAADSLAKFFSLGTASFKPVSLGTTGSQATALQTFLIKAGYLKIKSATGYFGSLTEAALKAFQEAHGLPQTGVVDQATFAAMNGG